ncbi:MAG: biotin/lipoyl-containing protein [Chloroflexota bacterium]
MSKIAVTVDGRTYQVELELFGRSGTELIARVNGEPVRVLAPELGGNLEAMGWIVVDDRPYEIAFDPDLHWLRSARGLHRLEARDVEALDARPRNGDGRVKAPIPGQITRVLVSVGQAVAAGEPLLVLEAMKMENEIRASRAGVVAAVHVSAGRGVARNELLTEIN